MIRPLRIAEVGRAIGERVRSHRSPEGLGQVRADFHYDNPAAGPTDVESKLIRPHSEAAIAGLARGFHSAVGRPPKVGPQPVVPGR